MILPMKLWEVNLKDSLCILQLHFNFLIFILSLGLCKEGTSNKCLNIHMKVVDLGEISTGKCREARAYVRSAWSTSVVGRGRRKTLRWFVMDAEGREHCRR